MASSADISLAMVAGEASGDLLAGQLLSGLRPMLPEARMHGIGGPMMAEHGFISDYPMDKLAVRGLFEVISHYRELKRFRDSLRDQLLDARPAAFIGVDAPDFNIDLGSDEPEPEDNLSRLLFLLILSLLLFGLLDKLPS